MSLFTDDDPPWAKPHIFQPIVDATALVLTHVGDAVRTDAVMVPMRAGNEESAKRPHVLEDGQDDMHDLS